MSQQITINGKTASGKPNEDLLINESHRLRSDIINGQVSTDIMINGYARPPVLPDCVLFLPLWHSKLSRQSPIYSMDKYIHTGTIIGALWTPHGRKFDGSDDYIVMPNDALFDPGTESITVEIWMKTTLLSGMQRVLNKSNCSAAPLTGMQFALYNTGAYFIIGDGVNEVNTGPITITTEWCHCVGVRNKATGKVEFWLNGVLKAQLTDTTIDVNYNSILTVGGIVQASQSLNGFVGECRIYKEKALAGSEIQNNYLASMWRYV